MDDHDIIEATTASGVDVSAGTREAIRGNLVRAIGGEHVVPPTSIRARTRRPSVARWGAAGLAAAAVIAVAVVVVTLDRSRQIGPVAPDTSSQPDASSGPLVPPATSLVAVPDTSATTTASSAPDTTAATTAPGGAALADLTGHLWLLLDTNGTPWPTAALPTVQFGPDATVTGFDGCRTYTMPFSIGDSTIHVDAGIPDVTGCAGVNAPARLTGGRLSVVDGVLSIDDGLPSTAALQFVSADSLAAPSELDGIFATSGDSGVHADFVAATHTVHLGACVSTWSLAGNTLTFSASNLPANCLDLNGLSPEDLALFDEITATTPATLVADPVRESIILMRGTSALRLHQLTQPAPTDSFDLYQAVVLGFSVGQVISPEDVAAALTPARGPATHDTRWYTASTGVVGDGATQCLSGLELRTLWWGDVSIAFWRRNGTESIWAWSIGDRRASLWEDRREPTAPDHPAASGITTAGSLHVGSPATDLQVQFADIMDPLAPRLEDGTQIYLSAMSTEPTVWQFDRDRDVNVGVSIKGGEVTGFGAALDACSSSSSSAGGAALTPSGALDLHLERATPTTPSVFGFAYGSDGDPTMIASTVSDVLGQPQQDTGWQPMPADLSCKGATEYRSILWADLRFVFEGYDTDGDGTTDRTRLAAWSIGAVQLELSPHLDAVITQHSAITTADGLGLGSPKSAVLEQDFFQIGDDGDTVFGLAKAVPVRFMIADDRVASMSVQDNDC